jgi:hypothetical protein
MPWACGFSANFWGGDNFVNNVPPSNLRGEFAQGGRQQHADVRRRFLSA